MKCEQAQELLVDAVDGVLGGEVATDLECHLQHCASCRREAAEVGETWSMLEELEIAATATEGRKRFYAKLSSDKESASQSDPQGAGPTVGWLAALWPVEPRLQMAFSVVALILGIGLGLTVGTGTGRTEIEQLRSEMRARLQSVTVSLLEHQSASERLRAVSLSREAMAEDRLVAELLDVVRHDSSVNVRLAALDVLAGLTRRADVRTGLLEAFSKQESPAMQVAMAEVLLVTDREGSRREILGILDSSNLPDTVRTYLIEILDKEELEI